MAGGCWDSKRRLLECRTGHASVAWLQVDSAFLSGLGFGVGRSDRQFISWRMRVIRSTAVAIPDVVFDHSSGCNNGKLIYCCQTGDFL